MNLQGLSSICAGLGVVEEDEDGNRVGYSKGVYCLDNLKDLLRFLAMKPEKTSPGPNKKILWDHGRLPSLNENILKALHDFLTQFLAGGYNVLTQSIREGIRKEHPNIQTIDVLRFFELAKFVTAFQSMSKGHTNQPFNTEDAVNPLDMGRNTEVEGNR